MHVVLFNTNVSIFYRPIGILYCTVYTHIMFDRLLMPSCLSNDNDRGIKTKSKNNKWVGEREV